jgi:glycosyltransferase involved in cell wall biosynthesis
MVKPQLSIIVPVYQAENYLKRCVDSILNQTFGNFELILVNDGSTDRSGEICNAYALQDNRIKVVHQNNGGQAFARNSGIKLAGGTYVGFVDNDDMIEPDMYDCLIHNAKEFNTDISACSFIQDNGDGTKTARDHTLGKVLLNNVDGVREFLSRKSLDIYIWTKIYRRAFIEKHHILFEEGKIDEDFLFNFEAFTKAQTTIMEDVPKYIYFHREDSASRMYSKQNLQKYLDLTLYRVDKILRMTSEHYPDLTYLANRQKIRYCLILLKAVIQEGRIDCTPQYKRILRYLKRNIVQLYRERAFFGNTPVGTLLIALLPAPLYYRYRRIKERMVKS